MESVLFRSIKLYAPGTPHHLKRQDLLIENGKITQIEDRIEAPERAKCYEEAADWSASMGWFDMRATLRSPGYEHKDTLEGLLASAANGGFTDVAVLPNTFPPLQHAGDLRAVKLNSEGVRLHPYAAATEGLEGLNLTEILELHHAGALAFTDGLKPLVHPGTLKRALLYLQNFSGLLINFPDAPDFSEQGDMHEGVISTSLGVRGIPVASEALAIQQQIEILRYTGGRLHFTCISSAKGVALIRQAKLEGLEVTADVAAHHLYFTEEALQDFNTHHKVMPPFRSEADRKALWDGLADDTIDAIVSNHCPHDLESKELEFDLADFGMLTMESFFSVLQTVRPPEVSTEKLIEKFTVSPRKILGQTTPKIAVGHPARLTLFNEKLVQAPAAIKHYSAGINVPHFTSELTGSVLGIICENDLRINTQSH